MIELVTINRGGKSKQVLLTPQTFEGCCPTITTRQGSMAGSNIRSCGHYPIPGVIETEYE